MSSNADWYRIQNEDDVDSPALIVYPQRVAANIRKMITLVQGADKLRPHVKTCKAKEPVRMMMKEGITKFKCATIAEAEMLAQCGVPDVLLAYQPTLSKLHRFISLAKNYTATRFSSLVDNPNSAMLFSKTAGQNGIVLQVFVDVNVGMNRTGVKPSENLRNLYTQIITLDGLKFMGFHAYDGHIEDAAIEERIQNCQKAFKALEELRNDLHKEGKSIPLLVAGGTPTCQIHSDRVHTECSPGTFVFWDKGYSVSLPEQPFLWAAVLLTRIVSLPDKGKVCIDLGHKSIASENDLQHRVFFLNAPTLHPVSHSEEHMVLAADHDHPFQVGDVLYAIPHHICPSIALYQNLQCAEGGKILGSWEVVARNRSINF